MTTIAPLNRYPGATAPCTSSVLMARNFADQPLAGRLMGLGDHERAQMPAKVNGAIFLQSNPDAINEHT